MTVTLHSVSSQAKHWLEADVTRASPVGPAYTTYTVAFQIGRTCYALATTTVDGGSLQQSAGGASIRPASLRATTRTPATAAPEPNRECGDRVT